MRQRLAAFAAGFALLLGVGLFLAAQARADELAGQFSANGQTPNGKAYAGNVLIKDIGSLDAILWKLDDGEAYEGIAIRRENVLAAAYGAPNQRFGVVVYKIHGGALEGWWADTGNLKADLGHENLQGSHELNGDYQITLGQNRDGMTNYTGKVTIRPRGDTYIFTWYVPSLAAIGVGIRLNDMLVVAYGTSSDPRKMPGVVAYQVQDPTALIGIWGIAGQKQTGTETLTRK
jgi:hypothetical protein